MSTIASQITSLTIVYSTIYSGADQSKHQSSASLAFVWGIHRGPVNSPHKWPVTRKMFPFDDVIMYNNVLCCSQYLRIEELESPTPSLMIHWFRTSGRGASLMASNLWCGCQQWWVLIDHPALLQKVATLLFHHLGFFCRSFVVSGGDEYRMNSSPLDKITTTLADDNFMCISLNVNDRTLIRKCVPRSPIDNKPALFQVMAWCRTGDKPLPEPMLTHFTDAYMRHQIEMRYRVLILPRIVSSRSWGMI